jgi:hypothetical protein
VDIGISVSFESVSNSGADCNVLLSTVANRTFEGIDIFVEVTEVTSTTAALSYALRKLALSGELVAERALLNDLFVLIEVTDVVRTSHCAELATDALFLVDLDSAVFFLVGSTSRANLNAERILAVLAADRQIVELNIRELTAVNYGVRSDTDDLLPILTYGDTVDNLAGDGANEATDAAVEVSNDSVLHG